MLPAVSGHLLSSAFIQASLPALDKAPGVDGVRRALLAWRARGRVLGPASTPRTLLHTTAAPLCAALGFDPPAAVEFVDSGAAATLRARHRTIALLVTPWGEALDPLWRVAVTQAIKRGAEWCLVFDGLRLRIVDAGRVYRRRHVEFDLDLALDHPEAGVALAAVAGAQALAGEPGDGSSLRALVTASDRHAAGVCRSLRDGVLAASGEVLQALGADRQKPRARRIADVDTAYEQALTIVYRMLFLLFAEARALVPVWHPIYRESYSLESLRDIADGHGSADGLWDALRAIARLAHAGCRAGDLRVTPFNGRLFAPARTPLADRTDLDDGAARRAVSALSTRPAADRAGRERIAYRDLGVQQLGAVYETLLDYQPHTDGRRVWLQAGSGLRKATGTFYTPQSIADYVVRRTLAPLVCDAEPQKILELRIVDPAMGSGAFLVAACRYLAAAYEASLVRSGGCHPSDIGDRDRAAMRRTIAERCLYGVDLNPMAVQLARLSLWLATLASDKPLSFLDHRLQSGDSLLGTWLANLRRPPDRGRRSTTAARLPLFDDEPVHAALQQALPLRFSLETMAGDTLDGVREKERMFATLTSRAGLLSKWKGIADLWCAAWFAPDDAAAIATAFAPLADTILTGRSELPADAASRYLRAADEAARSRRLFHWELEFPEVFFDRDGSRRSRAGFDAVIGNPPWDMIRADAGDTERRARARSEIAQILRFTRDAGIYQSQSDGHANRYQLFAERAIALTRTGGRIGLVLPSGLALDHGSARLRRRLFSQCKVDAIVGMDNHRGVFPIHRSVGFLLVTATPGEATGSIACRLGVDDPTALEAVGEEPADPSPWFTVRVSPSQLERLSGGDLALPRLVTPADLAIADRAASLFPPLGSAEGWSARFGRELNASDDRAAFCAGQHGLPVVDGRHLEPFHVALNRVERSITAPDARRLLRSERHARPRLAYRDVASATNRVTLIAAVLPAGCVSTHTVFCLRTPLPLREQHFLCGLFNSFVLNYLIRLRVSTHVTTAAVEQLPVPTVESAPAAAREIGALARHLSRRVVRSALAALNARVAELYQLSAAEFGHVLGTFPLVDVADRDEALRVFREGGTR
jgi:Eco57I restriction-modification methylase